MKEKLLRYLLSQVEHDVRPDMAQKRKYVRRGIPVYVMTEFQYELPRPQ